MFLILFSLLPLRLLFLKRKLTRNLKFLEPKAFKDFDKILSKTKKVPEGISEFKTKESPVEDEEILSFIFFESNRLKPSISRLYQFSTKRKNRKELTEEMPEKRIFKEYSTSLIRCFLEDLFTF
jgi:hypothetical protein